MKKNRLFAALAASALTLSLLAGCGASDAPTDTAPDTNTPSTSTPTPESKPEDTQKPTEGDASISELIVMLGLPDGELRAQFGDGTASVSPDDVLIAREYTRDVLGESGAPVSAVFGEDEKVSTVNVNFQTSKFDDAKTKLSEAYGEPADTQKSEESGGQNATWKLDGAILTLIEAYGAVSLSLTAA